ncbi:MAG: hypothetical protein RH982_13140 [Parvibaculum sp.]
MPKQVCLLHIGPQKTGSSAIQRWFADRSLEAEGIFYSKALGPVSHPFFVSLFQEYDADSPFTVDTGSRTAEDFSSWKKAKIEEFKEEVRSFRGSGLRFFVISHENLARLSPRAVEDVGKTIKPLFDEVVVAGFLRPDAELARSWISTHARNGKTIGKDFLDRFESGTIDTVRTWNAVFPSATWIPSRRYRSAIEPFARLLDLDGERHAPTLRTNERLDFKTAALLAHLKLPRFVGGERNANRQTYFQDTSFEAPVQISRAQAMAIQKRHRAWNEEIAAACSGVELSDLEIDPGDFPETGNFAVEEEPVYIDRLRETITRLNVQIHLEKCRSNLLLSQLHVERGQNGKAAEAHRLATRNLDAAQQARIAAVEPEIGKLRERLDRLRGKL